MPNWCEGTLKIRGSKQDVVRWVKQNVIAHVPEWKKNEKGFPYVVYNAKPDAVTVEYDEAGTSEILVTVTDEAYINTTHRNFVLRDEYWASVCEDDRTTLVMKFHAAWDIDPEPYVKMSSQYNVDFRLYGFEQGMEFNREVIVEGGQLIKNAEITFDDYEWECIFPKLGG